jgi:hypothetical protein
VGYSRIWLNLLVEDGYFGYITKVKKYRSPAFFSLGEKKVKLKNEKNEVIFRDFQLPEFPKTIQGKIT